MQRQRDRDYAKELCASRLAFTLSRTGTSKEDYCRAVGISSSTLSRILNKQTLMSTSTLIETARYFEDTSVSWFLDCRRTIESHRYDQALRHRTV